MTESDDKDPAPPLVRLPGPPGTTAWLVSGPEVLSGVPGLTGDLRATVTTELVPAGPSPEAPRPYRVSELAPVAQQIADDAIAGLTSPPTGLHEPFSRRIAAGVMHELVGGTPLVQQVTHIVAARRTAWGDDLLSRLMLHGRPSRELAAANVALLFAAIEAGARLLTESVHALLGRPLAWERLCDDPGLAPAVAESAVGRLGVELAVVRRALRDTTVRGHAVAAGDFVAATGVVVAGSDPAAPVDLASIANHDGSAHFPEDERDAAPEPAGASGGDPVEGLSSVRAWAGQQLALVQLTAALQRLAVRVPTLRAVNRVAVGAAGPAGASQVAWDRIQ